MKEFLVRSVIVRVFFEDGFYDINTQVGVDVGIEAVYVDGKQVGVCGNCHGSDNVQEMIGVFDVAGMFS